MGQELATATAGSGVNFQLSGTFNSDGKWEGRVNVNGNIGRMPIGSMIPAIAMGGLGNCGRMRDFDYSDIEDMIRRATLAEGRDEYRYTRRKRGPRVREIDATEEDIEENTIIIKYRETSAVHAPFPPEMRGQMADKKSQVPHLQREDHVRDILRQR